MRFVIATLLLVLSAISVVTGILIKGPFDAANYHKVSFHPDSTYSYVIIPHQTLIAYPGEVRVQASGTKEVFYADAREQDIQDWVGTSNFVRLNLDKTTAKPDISVFTGGGEDTNPEGSDMWRNSLKVKKELITDVAMFDDTAVLLASTGVNRAPNQITVSWQVANIINWPYVLLFGGLALLIAALIMNYIAFRHIRRLRGPRRRLPKAPRAPRYRKKQKSDVPRRGRRAIGRKVAFPATLISLTLLTGCAPAAQTESGLEKVTVVVSDSQLQRIVREVASTVKTADTNRDQALLITRVAGSALETRKVQYFLQQKNKKIPALAPVIANPITVALPMQLSDSALGWQPRTLMVATKSDDPKVPPQMLVLQQQSPRENYKLWYLIDLLPSDTFPTVAAQNVGALSFDATDTFLSTKLTSLPFKYGDVLNNGNKSKFFTEFDLSSDKFYNSVSALQKQQTADLKKTKVSIKYVHTLGNPNVIGMFTLPDEVSKGGGLVAIAVNDTSIIKPQVRGSAVSVTQLDHKILLDAPGSSTGLNIVYENQMLFFVPNAGSGEQIKLLGATQGLLSVKKLN